MTAQERNVIERKIDLAIKRSESQLELSKLQELLEQKLEQIIIAKEASK